MVVAKSTIELPQHVRPEARGQRRPWQIDDIADALQADAGEARDRRRRKPQRRERQWCENAALLAAGIACRFAKTCGSPGSTDGAGNGERIGETVFFQAAAEIGYQFALAAIKMCATADVEQQAIGPIAGNQRRVAQAPVGNGIEQGCIGLEIFGDDVNARIHGTRLYQGETGRKAELSCSIIDSRKNFDIAALAGDDQRRGCFMRRLTRSGDAVGRESVQPKAEHAL